MRRVVAVVTGLCWLDALPALWAMPGRSAVLVARWLTLAAVAGAAVLLYALPNPVPERLRRPAFAGLGGLFLGAILLTGGPLSPLRMLVFPYAFLGVVVHPPRAAAWLLAGLVGLVLAPALAAPPALAWHLLVTAASLAGAGAFAMAVVRTIRQQARQSRHLRVAADAAHRLSTPSLDAILDQTLDLALTATGGDTAAVFLADPDCRFLTPMAMRAVGPDREVRQRMQAFVLPWGTGLNGWAARERTPVLSGDAERDPRTFLADPCQVSDQSEIAVPLLGAGTVLGTMWVSRVGLNQFTSEDLHLVQTLAAQASRAIENARHYDRLDRQAITDPVTGVHNRHFLSRLMEQPDPAWQPGTVAVLMADLCNFKQVNDRWGHVTGDCVLRQVACCLRHGAGPDNPVIRYGGDEFLVLIPAADQDTAAQVQGRVEAALAAGWEDGLPLPRMSFGSALGPGTAMAELIDMADRAMYRARHQSLAGAPPGLESARP